MKLGYVTLPGRGETDQLLAELAARILQTGTRLAGTIQTNRERNCTHHCDMDLHVIPDGPVLRINQDLGAEATGCRLDAGALEAAVNAVAQRLGGAEALIVNKFGKHEAEGRGFRHLMGDALARGLPVIVGVNSQNMPAFLEYADGMAQPLPSEPDQIMIWLSQAKDVVSA